MKHVTASEARQNWFQLLDEVLDGEVVVIVRHGQRIVIRREARPDAVREPRPDYGSMIRVEDAGAADTWTWEWTGPDQDLTLREDPDEDGE